CFHNAVFSFRAMKKTEKLIEWTSSGHSISSELHLIFCQPRKVTGIGEAVGFFKIHDLFPFLFSLMYRIAEGKTRLYGLTFTQKT
ncbi:MAG: hypothetical protein IJ252_05705, partial [Solobacterium sp.]|nr:hypothetical protein [Solobacterium sp.]